MEASDFPTPVWSRHEPRIAGATDVGAVREVNQDAFGRFDDADRCEILLVVADGLGGHRGGEVASRLAVERIGAEIFSAEGDRQARLERAIERANDAIHEAGEQDAALDGMGTTVVCLLLAEEGESWIAHVGDSRLYRLRAGRIEALTEDHSLVATLVREGVLSEAQAREDPRRNQILRALGVNRDLSIAVAPVAPEPGDVFLLCSDGLHGEIDDAAILALGSRPSPPEPIVARLIEAANDAGGHDNVTCLIAQIPDPIRANEPAGIAQRLFESTRSVFSRRDAD